MTYQTVNHRQTFEKAPRDRAPVTAPFTLLIDSRERADWKFQHLKADLKHGGGSLFVQRRTVTLETGDYSIDGYEKEVTVERKSIDDLVGTLTTGRERFEREHERMQAMGPGSAVVMVEGSWADIWNNLAQSQMPPKVVHRTALSWLVRYGVPWLFFGSRELAEESCFRFLEKWYRQHVEAGERTRVRG